jgi:hypothetical protein
MHQKFPCPCCGHLVFDFQPGFHQLCPICGWEDDLTQLRFPLMPGSSNGVSLQDAQENLGTTRSPVEGEEVEPGWRPLDPAVDNVEHPSRGVGYADSYPLADTTVLYYWRPTYWRRVVG